jgi:hypothetical protein
MDANLAETSTPPYRGPLSQEQEALLRDMQGWIDYCIANGYSLKSVLSVLAYDANGLLADVPFFRPKVSGYQKYRTERDDLSGLAESPDANQE